MTQSTMGRGLGQAKISEYALGENGAHYYGQKAKYAHWNVQKSGKAPFATCEAKDSGQQLE